MKNPAVFESARIQSLPENSIGLRLWVAQRFSAALRIVLCFEALAAEINFRRAEQLFRSLFTRAASA
jgi:hypothetical protein